MLGAMDGGKHEPTVVAVWNARVGAEAAAYRGTARERAKPTRQANRGRTTEKPTRVDPAIIRRPSNCGHLLRQLKPLESLSFDSNGEQCYLTLLSSSPERVGIDLEVPGVDRMMLSIYGVGDAEIAVDLCRGRERALVSFDPGSEHLVQANGPDSSPLTMKLSRSGASRFSLDLDLPKIGRVLVAVRAYRDRAKLQVVADRSIRILRGEKKRG